jgi:hypothetical protein
MRRLRIPLAQRDRAGTFLGGARFAAMKGFLRPGYPNPMVIFLEFKLSYA